MLRDGRRLLLNLGAPGDVDVARGGLGSGGVDATHDDVMELPLLGEVAAPPAMLTRPDGYVAWTGDVTDPGLPGAPATWFGAA